jgi:hypothetical protein
MEKIQNIETYYIHTARKNLKQQITATIHYD